MFGTFHVIFSTAEPDKDRWISLTKEGESVKFGRAEGNDLALKDSAVRWQCVSSARQTNSTPSRRMSVSVIHGVAAGSSISQYWIGLRA